MSRSDRIQSLLAAALKIDQLIVEDESHGHGGGRLHETHFKIYLVSSDFEGLSRVQRSQKVQSLLQSEFQTGLHALSQRLLTQAEASLFPPETFVSPECLGGSKR